MDDTETPLSLSRIRDARAVLATLLAPSPCLPVDDGQARPGRVLVKAENLMPTGSFKIRGATYQILLLTAAERRQGVVAYSTGNHAQAVANAAHDAGVAATIVMSPDVPTAYAATIHKSQSSEYPAVVIPVLTQHYAMLQRNLLYTGVTRGKRLVVLVGQKKAIAIAVKNISGRRRWSKLMEWLGAPNRPATPSMPQG